MVRAAPNMARVVANIEDIRETNEPKLVLVNIHVLSSKPVSGYEDLVSKYIGKTIEVKLLTQDTNMPKDHIAELLVTYKGDEHGGSFYAEELPGDLKAHPD